MLLNAYLINIQFEWILTYILKIYNLTIRFLKFIINKKVQEKLKKKKYFQTSLVKKNFPHFFNTRFWNEIRMINVQSLINNVKFPLVAHRQIQTDSDYHFLSPKLCGPHLLGRIGYSSGENKQMQNKCQFRAQKAQVTGLYWLWVS